MDIADLVVAGLGDDRMVERAGLADVGAVEATGLHEVGRVEVTALVGVGAVVAAALIQIDNVFRTAAVAREAVVAAALIGDQQVVAAVLVEIQLVVAAGLGHQAAVEVAVGADVRRVALAALLEFVTVAYALLGQGGREICAPGLLDVQIVGFTGLQGGDPAVVRLELMGVDYLQTAELLHIDLAANLFDLRDER